MKLSRLTLPNGPHLFGQGRYHVTAAEGYDIEVTELGVLISQGDDIEWVPHTECEGGSVIVESLPKQRNRDYGAKRREVA